MNFSNSDKIKISLLAIIQVLLNLLDLIGVVLIGAIGSLGIAGLQGKSSGNRVDVILKFMGMQNATLQHQVVILSLCAAFILVLKTIISMYVTRRTLFFLSKRSASFTKKCLQKVFARDLTSLKKMKSQEFVFNLTRGADAVSIGIIGISINVISDIVLLLIMGLALFYVDPLVSLMTAFIFGLFGLLLYKALRSRASEIGKRLHLKNVLINTKLTEIYMAFREIYIRNGQGKYEKDIEVLRNSAANENVEILFLPNITKYVFEVILVLGTLFVAFIQFLTQNVQHAAATLAVYMAASSRIAPAILRIQQGLLQVKSNQSASESVLHILSMKSDKTHLGKKINLATASEFASSIELKNIIFNFPQESKPFFHGLNLKIREGEFAALVGPSGSGKSTLVDLILGVISPYSGDIEISGKSPNLAINEFIGAVGYVPQEPFILDGTIRENLELGLKDNSFSDNELWAALRSANLEEVVRTLERNLETPVGERGSSLSGGQKQRLALARCLLTKPKLLILDEATSALDSISESVISNILINLKGDVTILLIAHRLSTVLNADKVIYMDSGKILAIGTFEEVKSKVPKFREQAYLLGL